MARYLAARLAIMAMVFEASLVTFGLVGGGTALAAQDAPAAPSAQSAIPATDDHADPFEQAMAARATADFARRHHDVQAMLVAARLLEDIPVKGDATDTGFAPAALYAEARAMAAGDDAMVQQITLAEAMHGRGVLSSAFGSGLVRRVLNVNPRAAFQFVVNAKGGERLRLGAIGAPGTSLLMRILDTAGRTVCLDDHGDYAPVCQLTPAADARFRVDIQNKSAQTSQTVVLSN